MVRLRAVAIRRAAIPIEVSFQMSLQYTSLVALFFDTLLDADMHHSVTRSAILDAASLMQV
jgi:hypothetical protein